jgi:hypothetical protein
MREPRHRNQQSQEAEEMGDNDKEKPCRPTF